MMPEMGTNWAFRWKLGLVMLIASFTLLACRLPAQILESVRHAKPTQHPTPTISPSPSWPGKKPAVITPTSTGTFPSEQHYPYGAETTETNLSADTTAYPGQGGETTKQTNLVGTEDYPPSLATTPGVEETTTGGYPFLLEITSYPGFPTLPPQDNAYPVGTASATAEGQTQPATVTVTLTQIPTYRPPITATPLGSNTVTTSPTSTKNGSVQSETTIPTIAPRTPTGTATFLVPSPMPSPTLTRFLTPTPTLTFTPTPTRTPLPYPPWLSVQIYASNPKEVRLAAGKPQLIMFFAYWSGPSLAMAPIAKGMEKEYLNRVNFIYLDIDNPDTISLKSALRYKTAPHFLLLNGQGKVVQEWVGYVSVERLREALEAILSR